MVEITLNGQTVEAAPGRRLVEVIKEQGLSITNLCYIDGLEPYAGCRTCLVEIEGARPTALQLSCVAQVAEGMKVTTDTAAVKSTRNSVLSLILANHPDRCLTCHRRVHCMPGDICLRDDVVTHRCLTCSKNYRCELQTSCEITDQGDFEEPWVGETRSYYEVPPPEPDRGNPYLEFDPQMCIICTRCVRACDSLRHTGAVTLSGKGHTTMIAFGTGGQVHESDCDFCGACIDVCPTATLMEKPNKWVGLATDWTNSVCNGCSVGCTISYGTAGDRPVIVKPDRVNPASRDQICVRGRFGYVAISDRERLTRSLVRAGDRLLPMSFDEAMQRAIESIEGVKRAHGANAVAVLGSPLALNEETHLLVELSKAIGTPHLDFSHGPIHRAVSAALTGAFGTHRLPSSLPDLEASDAIFAIASDLEESHQVASLRIKDAVVKRHAQLVVISAHWGELDSFAAAVLRVRPGHEATVANALAEGAAAPDGIDATQWANALAVVAKAQAAPASATVVFAPNPIDSALQGEAAKAAANLAIAVRGAEAASGLLVLPTDANVNGIVDMGVTPGAGGKSFPEIIAAAQAGEIKALVIHADNPLLNAPGTDAIRAALANLDALVVIDEVRSTTAEYATVVLAETPFHAEDGTITNADRRVLRQRPGAVARGQERAGVGILAALAQGLGSTKRFATVSDIARDMHEHVAAFPAYSAIDGAPGNTRALPANATYTAQHQPVAAPVTPVGIALTTNRSLFTSWAGASVRSEEADQLHREESAWVNPRDAEALGARNGEAIVLTDGTHEVRIALRLEDGVPPGTVYVPHYYDGGAIMALLPLDGTGAGLPIRLAALQPA
ncbi:MAG: hypothetical protein DWI58_01400 [Chloroflexi bacterium]|nr:MAG: hypothetical protein DWI58_01400 [Chloroflexota bacterium]